MDTRLLGDADLNRPWQDGYLGLDRAGSKLTRSGPLCRTVCARNFRISGCIARSIGRLASKHTDALGTVRVRSQRTSNRRRVTP